MSLALLLNKNFAKKDILPMWPGLHMLAVPEDVGKNQLCDIKKISQKKKF